MPIYSDSSVNVNNFFMEVKVKNWLKMSMHIFSHFCIDSYFLFRHYVRMENISLQQKIEMIREAKKRVSEHPMTFSFIEQRHRYVVIFSEPVRGISGVRTLKNGRKLDALNRMHAKLEKFWKLSNEVLYPNEYL